MRLANRLSKLEKADNNEPMLSIDVDECPTPEQQVEIDRATKTGRKLMVFDAALNWGWMPGAGMPPPWEA